jgi:predicted anti-sigma-YlaC factor YlaD
VSAVRPHPDCTRAREWASLELDGELSDFEQFLLRAHLASCEDCSRFGESVGAFTHELRAAPLEQLDQPVAVRRRRRRVPLRMPAAAAFAVAAVGLGSLFASLDLGDKVSSRGVLEGSVGSVDEGPTSLLRRAGLQRRQILLHRRQVAANRRSDLRGGPVR